MVWGVGMEKIGLVDVGSKRSRVAAPTLIVGRQKTATESSLMLVGSNKMQRWKDPGPTISIAGKNEPRGTLKGLIGTLFS